MPYNYDPNKYKNTFDNMFGKGSYNAGMKQARNVGYWKAQPEIEKRNFNERIKAFKEAQKEAERTYKAEVKAEKEANKEKYKMQETAKKQGRGGVMPSREQERKEAKIQTYRKKHDGKFPKAIQDELDGMKTLSKSHIDSVHKGKKSKGKSKKSKKKQEKGVLDKVTSFFGKVKKDVVKSAKDTKKSVVNESKRTGKNLKYNVQALNPFDNVSMKEANKKISKNNKKYDKNKGSKEVVRQFNRLADSGSLGAVSNVQKRAGVDTSYKKTRKLGKGGATDVITDTIGMLTPGAASYKAADKVLKAGKIGKTLSKSKSLKELSRGSLAGAGFGAVQSTNNELFDPDKYSAGDFAKNVATNAALGGFTDLGLHKLSEGIRAMRKANTASTSSTRNVMNDDPFNVNQYFGSKRNSVTGTFDGQSIVDANAFRLDAPTTNPVQFLNGPVNPMDDVIKGLNSPIIKDPAAKFRNTVNIEGTPLLNSPLGGGQSSDYWKQKLDQLNTSVPDEGTLNEFNDAIQKQYDYLRESMANRKGVETGLTDNGMIGNQREFTGRYTISNNPQWFRDFYSQNGRTPNTTELRQMAEEQVLQGFKDEYGEVPAWMPKAVDDLDQQAFDVQVAAPEGGDEVDAVLKAIDEQKEQVYKEYEKIVNGSFNGTRSTKEAIQQLMKNDPELRNVSQQQLEELANPIPVGQNGSPLKFKKQVMNRGVKMVDMPDGRRVVAPNYREGEFLNYTGNMSPNQRVAQRVEGQFRTSPTNDGLKISQDQPLPFMKQEPALQFKKQITKEVPRKDLTEVQTQNLNAEGAPVGDGYDYKNPQFKTRMFAQFFNDEVSDAASEVGKKINRDSPSKFQQFKENVLENTKGFRTKFIDDLAPLEALEKKVRGGVASAEDSLYKQARLFRGSPERAHQVVNEQLSPIIKEMKANNIKLTDLVDYATAVHARDLNKKGLTSGLSDADIQKDIIRFESPIMEKLRRELVEASNNVTKKELVDTGILSQEAFDAMRAKHPNYMPMFRHFDDDKVEFSNGISSAIANATNPIKKFKGSERDIIDPVESMVKNMFNAVTQGDKQRVAQQLGKLADEDIDNAFVRRLSPDEARQRKNTVRMFENGKEVHLEVEPDVYKAIKGLDDEAANDIVKWIAKPASWLRAGATLTPEFSMRNFMRDIPAAYIVSESGFNPLIDFPVGLWQSLSVKAGGKTLKDPGKLYQDFIKHNGGYGNIVSNDRKLHQEVIQKVLKEGDSPKFRNIVNPKSYLNVLRAIADVSESAVKVGEYRAALRKGVSPQEAAYRARDIMDFARTGNNVKTPNKMVAFLNANIQGKDKLARSLAKHPAKFMGKAFVAVSLPTIGVIAAQHTLANDKQKEAIKDAPQWLKNSFWLMPIPGTNQIARIPKPFDVSPLFADPIERAAEYAFNKNPKAFDGYIKQTFSSMSIPVLMSGLVPVLEGAMNYSLFRQGPIDSRSDDNKEYPDHYDIKTSSTAKWIGKGVNKLTGGEGPLKNFGSPRIVDNTIRGLTGGLGTYAVDGLDAAVVNPLEKLAGAHDGIKKPAKQINQQPILRAFLMDQGSTGESMNKLYDLREKLTKQKGSKNPQFNEAKYNKVKDATQQIGGITKDMRAIENSKTLSGAEKRKRLDELNRQRNQVARRAASKIN
ncbi:LPD38 domain-containing protein [Priestia aryabhattai]|uniref:LPD38 domain-containing protein n=1 Tax=Priestia aryabhattai TaxID=412384 RepID=UPI0039A29A1A